MSNDDIREARKVKVVFENVVGDGRDGLIQVA